MVYVFTYKNIRVKFVKVFRSFQVLSLRVTTVAVRVMPVVLEVKEAAFFWSLGMRASLLSQSLPGSICIDLWKFSPTTDSGLVCLDLKNFSSPLKSECVLKRAKS